MKKNNIIIILLVALFSFNCANAQKKGFDRFEIGGQFGFNVQNKMGALEFSPVVGYRVLEFFTVNVGLIGQYAWNKENRISEWSYGISTGARLVLFNLIYIEGRYAWNPHIINYKEIGVKETNYDNAQCLWAGAGYRQQMGSNAYSYVGIFYDFMPLIKNDPNLVNDYNPRVEAGVTYTF